MTVGAFSKDRQFYFIGKYDRLGSISQDGKDKNGIYLRWDLIEGEFPSDIKKISLMRVDGESNTTLLHVDAKGTMNPTEISNIFQQYGSERQLFEVVDFISNSDDAICNDANIANIGTKIEACFSNNYWSFLASRVNFGVAEARYRAYLDTTYDKSKNFVEYYLLGETGQQKMVLGHTIVKMAKSFLPKAKEFKQIIESKCNDNRYALNDYRIGLSWENGGVNSTESFANSLMVSGYDLYYSLKSVNQLPKNFTKLEIADLAKNVVHNDKGEVNLAKFGLGKANDTLITLGSQKATVGKPIYIESMKDLKQRGFKPGEERYYFLVAKDFTGNYGKTVALKVTIPDLLPPPTPINPRVIEDNGRSTLIWNSVTLKSYADYYEDSLKVCNRKNITKDSRVQFVNSDEVCQEGKGIMVNFNVDKYYVYRFDNAHDASEFEDLDLDGYNDFDESDKEKCSSLTPLKKTNYRVAIVDNNGPTIKFHDETIHQGQEYWYKIVSVTSSKISSPMTAPIRAFIPKREMLTTPVFTVKHNVFSIDLVNNNEAELNNLAEDLTKEASKVQIVYENQTFEYVIQNNRVSIDQILKDKLFQHNDSKVKVTFLTANNIVVVGGYFDFSLIFNFERETEYGDDKNSKKLLGYRIISVKKRVVLKVKKEILKDGGSTQGECVEIHFDEAYYNSHLKDKDICIQFTKVIGSSRYKDGKKCNIQRVEDLCTKNGNVGRVDEGVQTEDDDGSNSIPVYIHFFPNYGAIPKPNVPSLISLEMNKEDKKAVIKLRPQIEKVTGTMLYLYNKDGNISKTKIVPHIGQNDPLKTIEDTITGIDRIVENDTWCLKAKTIGLGGKMSDWSAVICQDILPEEDIVVKEDLLAWPKISNNVRKGKDFDISFNEDLGVKIKLLETEGSFHNEPSYRIRTQATPSNTIVTLDPSIINDPILKDKFSTIEVAIYIEDEKIYSKTLERDGNVFKLPSFNKRIDSNSQQQIIIEFSIQDINNVTKIEFEDVLTFNEKDNTPLLSKKVVVSTVAVFDGCSILKGINKVSNFVIYRQTINDDGANSKFVQVSPLINGGKCKDNILAISNNLEVSSVSDSETLKRINYVDKYPYIAGEKYKYMMLFFDKKSGEMSSYSLTTPSVLETH